MGASKEFAKVLKYGKCNSKVHGNCINAARKYPQACPMPSYSMDLHAYHACTCCQVCYNHCKEEAKQNNEDFMESFKDWSSWKNRTKRNIKDKITKWCGST